MCARVSILLAVCLLTCTMHIPRLGSEVLSTASANTTELVFNRGKFTRDPVGLWFKLTIQFGNTYTHSLLPHNALDSSSVSKVNVRLQLLHRATGKRIPRLTVGCKASQYIPLDWTPNECMLWASFHNQTVFGR